MAKWHGNVLQPLLLERANLCNELPVLVQELDHVDAFSILVVYLDLADVSLRWKDRLVYWLVLVRAKDV